MSRRARLSLIVLGLCSLAGTRACAAEALADSVGLSLEDVLRRVLERNPSIAVARATTEEARSRAGQAGSIDDPMLEFMTAPGSYGSSLVDPAYRVGLTLPLPIFGQRGLRADVAEAEGRAAGFDLRTMQLDLLQEARRSYFDYWRIVRAADRTQELLRLMSEFREVTLAKYSAGLVGQQDPLQADAEIAMLDHEAVVLERERKETVARLNVLMHDPADQELPPPPRELPVPDTTVVHPDLVPMARALRPELRAADAMIEAGRADVSRARRDRWPTTSFGVSYDRYWNEPELRPSVTIGMSLPLNFGRLSAARSEAQARLTKSEAERRVVDGRIAFEVATAVARLHESAHDLAISRDRLVPLAGRTVVAARAGYEANRSDFLTLLSAVRSLLRAHVEADAAFAMLGQARADLDRALGRTPESLPRGVEP